jgi:catechol 2,3-dioxygenase-like lactoylglutathione lyase family enzyme
MPQGGEAKARAFYNGLLGIPEFPKPAELAGRGGCWFVDGALKLHIGVEPDFKPSSKAHCAFIVEDLPALTAKLREAGFEIRDGEAFDGYARAYVTDPFGNRIELMEPANAAKA